MVSNVNLITSGAGLLSGDIDGCLTPEDESCEGGIAAVAAIARQYTEGEPSLLIQKFDKNSPFVNMHPLQWVVNRLVFNGIFGLNVLISNPSLLYQNKGDPNSVSKRDISALQTKEMPFLLSNSAIPPSYSWYQYTKAIHFDKTTGLAIANLELEGVPLAIEQIAAAKGILDYIAKVNMANGCSDETDAYEQYVMENTAFSTINSQSTDSSRLTNATSLDTTCWISVLLYSDVETKYYEFLDAVTTQENPPNIILNLEDAYESFSTPQKYNSTNVWVGSCPLSDDIYCQHRITTSDDGKHVDNVTFISIDLEEMPPEFKDELWGTHINLLRLLADDAQNNNPVLGYSGFMPITRIDSYRACNAGECPLGNLFTDAIRYFTDTDIAFTTSGGYRGEGWPAGEVRLTDLYGGLPFPNTQCVGTMSGVSLFQLLNYSTSIATFEGEDTSDGGRLLQVSGMVVSYNTLLQGSRLISVDVWNRETNMYEPLDRLKLYTFSTDSYVCGAYDPYPDLTGGSFAIEGEVPGRIGDDLVQNIVAIYLSELDSPYDTSTRGRLLNETKIFEQMDVVQNEATCPANTVWSEESLTCFPCPTYDFVLFSDEVLYFEADSDHEDLLQGRIVLVNRENFGVSVLLKSKPRWIEFTAGDLMFGNKIGIDENPIFLDAGDSLALEFDVISSSLASGTDRTALGTVSFGVEDGGGYPRCRGQDATFDVALRVTPADQLNQLGTIRYAGVALTATVFMTTIFIVGWVVKNRNTRIVKVMQPLFLLSISLGILILSGSIISMTIDDEIVSPQGCNIACMITPWLLSTGFTLSFAALFSKLWRINRLFNGTQACLRVVVTQRDVLAPFAILFMLNLVFLLTWTFMDPLRWTRVAVGDEDWNTYGVCAGGNLSRIMLGLLSAVNGAAFLLACAQAYLARNISDEFSESKYIGIAIYGWAQILIVGVPILFLIDRDNPTARYFLQVVIIFIVSMSMLLIIFVPAFVNLRKVGYRPGVLSRVTISGISTGDGNAEQSRDIEERERIVRSSLSNQARVTRNHSQSAANNVRTPSLDDFDKIIERFEESSSSEGGYDGPSFAFNKPCRSRHSTIGSSKHSTMGSNSILKKSNRSVEEPLPSRAEFEGKLIGEENGLTLQMESSGRQSAGTLATDKGGDSVDRDDDDDEEEMKT